MAAGVAGWSAGLEWTRLEQTNWTEKSQFLTEVKYHQSQYRIKEFLVWRRLSEGVNVKTATKIQSYSLSKGSL